MPVAAGHEWQLMAVLSPSRRVAIGRILLVATGNNWPGQLIEIKKYSSFSKCHKFYAFPPHHAKYGASGETMLPKTVSRTTFLD